MISGLHPKWSCNVGWMLVGWKFVLFATQSFGNLFNATKRFCNHMWHLWPKNELSFVVFFFNPCSIRSMLFFSHVQLPLFNEKWIFYKKKVTYQNSVAIKTLETYHYESGGRCLGTCHIPWNWPYYMYKTTIPKLNLSMLVTEI